MKRPALHLTPLGLGRFLRSAVAVPAAGVLVGCVSSPRALPSPVQSPLPTALASVLAGPWFVRPSSESHTRELRLDAVLTSRVEDAVRVDTLFAIVVSAWQRDSRSADADRIAGAVTDYRVAFGGGAPLASPADLQLPVPFSAERRSLGGRLQFTAPPADTCAASAVALHALSEMFVSPPETLTRGLVWNDSATYVVCRDSIPLLVHSARRFRVLGAVERNDTVFVHVERNSSTTLSGRGRQFGEEVSVEATGRGTMLFEILLDGGVPASGVGEADLTLVLRGRRRTQELRQQVRLTIRAP